MGCINTKTDINDRHPNIFQVTNVNEQGLPISPGKLQVTETELVLYQRGKEPTRWPLRSLRKYGFDTEVFSFECGRRCPTGQGIYAFQCRRAEQLFNIVSEHISGTTNEDGNNMNVVHNPNNIEFPIPAVSTGPPVQRRMPEGYLNPVSGPATVRVHPSLSRPGSITSNGPVSPPATSPPPITADVAPEHNNNKRGSLIPEHAYTNTSALENNGTIPMNYMNLVGGAPTAEGYINIVQNSHVYMNVDTKDSCPNVNQTKETTESSEVPEPEDPTHCYANIDNIDVENFRPKLMSIDRFPNSVPQTPHFVDDTAGENGPEYIVFREVNYAELDLDPSKILGNPAASVDAAEAPPESPTKVQKSYATIDFQKTNALSQSINPRMETEEGSRKTRHNSTINYNNSLSD